MRKTSGRREPRPSEKAAASPKSISTPQRRFQKSRPRRQVSAKALSGVRLPPPGSGKRGENGHIGYLLRQAQAATRLTVERALMDLGVTTPQFAVLTMLNAYPGLSGADVARIAFLTPQTVGVIISNLERDGAIGKKPHPVHGRILQWTLTRRGSELLGKCRRRVNAVERRLVAGLGGKAEIIVRRWLSKIAADLHDG
jgi:DNA-binding MarR family transcriptional regulator